MNNNSCTSANDRSIVMLRANTWGLNFILFALLADIMYRSLAYGEAAWDLFALLCITGAITFVYAKCYDVQVLNRKSIILTVVGGAIAALIAAILAYTRAM